MQLIKYLAVSSVFIVPSCFSGILNKPSEPDKSSIVTEAAIQILASCYKNQGNAVVFAGNSVGKVSKELWSKIYVPVILLSNTTRGIRNGSVSPLASHKLQVFVVATSSLKTLGLVVAEIKDSPWWNHMASVLILDWSDSTRGCTKAFAILKGAWKMNLLQAKFICLDRAMRILLYSYNPYTSHAPYPWKLMAIYRRENEHPWALFMQRYHQGTDICEKLDFEKRYDLGGHEIRVVVKNVSGIWSTNPNKNGTDSFAHLDGKIAELLFQAVNATLNIQTFNKSRNLRPTIVGNMTIGGDIDVKNGIYDMGLNTRFPEINATMSYPIRESGLLIMTQYRGRMSQLGKIIAVLDRSSRIGLFLVALNTVIFFNRAMQQRLIPAFLNVWRIYCNMCIPKVPKTQAARLYLSGLYLLMINIQGVYQGKMAALLTTEVALPDVHTVRDIIKYGLSIYTGNKYAYLFRDPAYTDGFVIVPGTNCSEIVLNDYWAACVHEKHLLLHQAADFGLHISHDLIVKFYRMYVFRPDWPLEGKINTVIARLVESGLVQYWDDKDTQRTLRILELNENIQNEQTFKVITLLELRFAFSIFGIGFSFATVSFIVEIGINSAGLKIANTRNNIRNRLEQITKYIFHALCSTIGKLRHRDVVIQRR